MRLDLFQTSCHGKISALLVQAADFSEEVVLHRVSARMLQWGTSILITYY